MWEALLFICTVCSVADLITLAVDTNLRFKHFCAIFNTTVSSIASVENENPKKCSIVGMYRRMPYK
jgi:hypothetical protein